MINITNNLIIMIKTTLVIKIKLIFIIIQGIPTHDVAGEPIAKSQLKKLQKVYDNHLKKHNDYLKNVNEG